MALLRRTVSELPSRAAGQGARSATNESRACHESRFRPLASVPDAVFERCRALSGTRAPGWAVPHSRADSGRVRAAHAHGHAHREKLAEAFTAAGTGPLIHGYTDGIHGRAGDGARTTAGSSADDRAIRVPATPRSAGDEQ